MSTDGGSGLDRLVNILARAMDALGLNGTRLRWRWNQKKLQLGEDGLKTEIMFRSARGRHKMCPACRALVSRRDATCPQCGATLARVRAPGAGRLLQNLFPGLGSATPLILLVNGFWFLMMMMAQINEGSGGGGLFGGFGGELLFHFGSGYSPATTSGEWWRLITPIFLHGGIVHFFFNSYVLLQLGPLVEEEFGTDRFWVIYLACGIAGSATSQLVRVVNTVGASGAILGLIGLLLVHGWRSGGSAGQNLKGAMVRYVAYILVFGLLIPGIDNLNHLGGLGCGALMGLVVPPRRRGERSPVGWQAAALAGAALVLYCFFCVARQL